MYVIHMSILVSRINISVEQSRKLYRLSSFSFSSSLSPPSHKHVSDLAIEYLETFRGNRNSFNRICSRTDPIVRIKRESTYIKFIYLALSQTSVIVSELRRTNWNASVFSFYLHVTRGSYPSSRINKPVSSFFRSVNTTTWIVRCKLPSPFSLSVLLNLNL